LHCANQDSQAGAVQVSDVGKIDNQGRWLLRRNGAERFRDLRRNVEIDLAFKRQNIWLFFSCHRRSEWTRLFHFFQASPVDHQPSVLIRRSTSERSSIKISGSCSASFWRLQVPVATAMVRAPSAFPQAISRGVSPMTSISSAENSRPCFSCAPARANAPSSLRLWWSSAKAPNSKKCQTP